MAAPARAATQSRWRRKAKTATQRTATGAQEREATLESLSEGQQRVLQLLDEGRNVLMLGEGGTGKTALIKVVQARQKRKKVPMETTASTGRAALLIDGSTVHSFAGVGLGNGTIAENIEKVVANSYAVKRWRRARFLVIDELSMISADFLHLLDCVARAARGRPSVPFGGMQLLGSGDMLQLPPVKADFCFRHDCFDALFSKESRVVLSHNFRQDQDAQFRSILRGVRWGKVTPDMDAALQARVGVKPAEGVPATFIYPRRAQVDELNEEKMAALPGELCEYEHEFTCPGASDAQFRFLHSMLLKSAPCCDILGLKVGAQVMHTRNNKKTGKVNGSMGTVAGYEARSGDPIVQWADGTEHSVGIYTWTSPCLKACLRQYPLIVAWAVTIHKVQGATLDAAIVDLGPSVFEYNQAYTALGRVRRLQDLHLIAWDKKVARPHPDAIAFYADLGVEDAM